MIPYFKRATTSGLVLTAGLALAALALIAVQPASATSTGRTGASGNPATGGQTCNRCHSGGVAPEVTLAGPQLVAPGATYAYSLTIAGGQRVAGGFNVSATGGELDALPDADDVQPREGELTHTLPKTVNDMGQMTFAFQWTAPMEAGEVTFYGAGNSVDGSGDTSGDAASAVTLAVTVGDGGSPTPTAVPTEPPDPTATPSGPDGEWWLYMPLLMRAHPRE